MGTIVIALGGNAILKRGERGTKEDQIRNVEETCRQIAEIYVRGYRIAITHGNGPQIGNIMLQNEAAKEFVPEMPMDVCGAESQGLIGYLIQQTLKNEFLKRGQDVQVVTVVTQCVVDKNDKAFKNPTKPVGPFYKEKKELEKKGYSYIEDSGRGYRRVVPSPKPHKIVESRAIKKLLDNGVVIACGGGGIPVVEEKGFRGIEAVIDKDLASERLAYEIGAKVFLILTDVDFVYLNFGKKNQKPLKMVSFEDLEKYLRKGEFGEGSMKPKIEAALKFLENGGEKVIITSISKALDALEGKIGTHVTK